MNILKFSLALCLVLLGIQIGCLQMSNKYEEDIEKLRNDKQFLIDKLDKQECDCGWYEDFYYDHAEEKGAFE